MLFDHFKFDVNEIEELIGQKEVSKPVSQEAMFANWTIAKKEKEEESTRIYYGVDVKASGVEALIGKIKINVR